MAAGFTEKQLPVWVGSKADTIDKNALNTKNTLNTKKTKNTTDKITIEPMKPSP